MNINVLFKVPERARKYIVSVWNFVYTTKSLSKERGWSLVEGVLYGTYWAIVDSDYPEDFTGEDLNKVLKYYDRWFSL